MKTFLVSGKIGLRADINVEAHDEVEAKRVFRLRICDIFEKLGLDTDGLEFVINVTEVEDDAN